MQNNIITRERGLLLLILVLLGVVLTQQRCNSFQNQSEGVPKVTIIRDTVWQTKIDTFKVQTEKYKTVYVPSDKYFGKGTEVVKSKESFFREAREYRDTLQNEDIEIYSYSLVEGALLDANLSYKLKVPREINTTRIIEQTPKYRSRLYAFGEVGGNQQQFDNISLGLQYNRKGKWFMSYRLNVSELSNVTHNIGVGIRLK